MVEPPPLKTKDALPLAGIGEKEWADVLYRDLYPHAPKTTQGKSRKFALDDLVAGRVFALFRSVGATPYWAAVVGQEVLNAMARNPQAKVLTVYRITYDDGTPGLVVRDKPPPGGEEFVRLPIQEYRRAMRHGMREKHRQQGT
jgi:hypothetical protein